MSQRGKVISGKAGHSFYEMYSLWFHFQTLAQLCHSAMLPQCFADFLIPLFTFSPNMTDTHTVTAL